MEFHARVPPELRSAMSEGETPVTTTEIPARHELTESGTHSVGSCSWLSARCSRSRSSPAALVMPSRSAAGVLSGVPAFHPGHRSVSERRGLRLGDRDVLWGVEPDSPWCGEVGAEQGPVVEGDPVAVAA